MTTKCETERVVSASWIDREGTRQPATAVNPGDWWGKTWLLYLGDCFSPVFHIVEADCVDSAIDELIDSEKCNGLLIDDVDIGDYDEDLIHYGPNGQPCDIESLHIEGIENADVPFACRYHSDGLPEKGIDPRNYESWLNWKEEN